MMYSSDTRIHRSIRILWQVWFYALDLHGKTGEGSRADGAWWPPWDDGIPTKIAGHVPRRRSWGGSNAWVSTRKIIWIELWILFFIVFDFRLDESYFHAFAELCYLWFSCLPLCIPTTIYNMFYILWLMMALWITLSQFPFSLLVLLWRHLPTESRRPTSLERWLIACYDPCCIYKFLCVLPYVSWVLLTDIRSICSNMYTV